MTLLQKATFLVATRKSMVFFQIVEILDEKSTKTAHFCVYGWVSGVLCFTRVVSG